MSKVIMVQGTTSGAGKSLLTAGLCRIFRQDGHRVAPFKSQNMALNSFITRDGLEIGRAQAMQAEAAGIEPSVDMNPILLKPTNDVGSQVIVGGEVLGNMPAREYFKYKKKLIPDILHAYERLSACYDIIVVEGAGSPAEINLKADDIVNMGLAKMLGAPVLLAGDIDRGGVFASLYGTVALLTDEERGHIKGTVINKFRGDVEILRPGLSMLEELTNVPVLGVVPMLPIDIDDEDSLSERFQKGAAGTNMADIAVIRLPRISNFTDFNRLQGTEGVCLRYVSHVREMGRPDLIIIPGTKSTFEDLRWMRQNGLEAQIKKLSASGTAVLGICGGYQMLGTRLSDPQGVEGGGELRGMELLNTYTLFAEKKTRAQVSGTVAPLEGALEGVSGAPFQGYEIHMGITKAERSFSILEDGQFDGACGSNVYGTYVHGLLDGAEMVEALRRSLLIAKGIAPEEGQVMDAMAYKNTQYDLLADALRGGLDMAKVYAILEKGIKR